MAKKAHFIGICGAGMGAVAKLLRDFGWEVTGSDDGFYPPVSTYLTEHHIPVSVGYRKENIPPDATVIIIGKHARLVPETNEEVKAAFESGIPVKSFPEVLGELSQGYKNIIVAGSYGKSSCTALIAWCLEQSGKSPSYLIGAIPKTPSESSRKGDGNLFVIEGDEYPSANWDGRSKFLWYHPDYLLLTSLAHDHLDVFKTEDDYRAPFKKIITLVPSDGTIVACKDGTGLMDALEAHKNVVWYSAKGTAEWSVQDLVFDEETSFTITHNDNPVVSVKTHLLGLHNVENIVGAAALLLTRELVTLEEFARAIESFQALTRRLDKKSEGTLIPSYEGFGSSYAKVVSAIDAIRLHFPNRRLVVIFEPHTFSWRNRQALAWYDTAFAKADEVLIYRPPQHAVASEQLTLSEIVDRVNVSGVHASGFNDSAEGSALLEKYINKDSAVLILSSGAFDGFIDVVVRWLEEKFPKP